MTAGADGQPAPNREARAIAHRIQRACREALPRPGPARLLVGVSGGPDSSALLLALADGTPRHGWTLIAGHVDHGIAAPSVRREFRAAAARLAKRAGVPLRTRRVDAPAESARAGGGLEAAARRLRYQALAAIAVEGPPAEPIDAIVVGHTMDDQAESVLLHLVRGSGLDGLAGMPARGVVPLAGAQLPLIRPLLGLRRAQLLELCRAFRLTPLADPANTDPLYTRVRIRNEILPRLAALNPAIVERLASLAGAVARDRALLDQLTTDALQELAPPPLTDPPPAGEIYLSRRALRRHPPAIRARLLRRQIGALGGELPDWERTAALLRLVERGGHRIECAGGVTAQARGDRLCLRRDAPV